MMAQIILFLLAIINLIAITILIYFRKSRERLKKIGIKESDVPELVRKIKKQKHLSNQTPHNSAALLLS